MPLLAVLLSLSFTEQDRGAKEEDDDEEEESNRVGSKLYPGNNPNVKRQGRMRFTPAQIQVLERKFQKQHYLLPADRKFLAKSLQMTERQVKTWFQNKRAQYKRTRPLVRNPVYHHPGFPGTTPLPVTALPRLQVLQAGPLGINIHFPVTPSGALGCNSTLSPPSTPLPYLLFHHISPCQWRTSQSPSLQPSNPFNFFLYIRTQKEKFIFMSRWMLPLVVANIHQLERSLHQKSK